MFETGYYSDIDFLVPQNWLVDGVDSFLWFDAQAHAKFNFLGAEAKSGVWLFCILGVSPAFLGPLILWLANCCIAVFRVDFILGTLRWVLHTEIVGHSWEVRVIGWTQRELWECGYFTATSGSQLSVALAKAPYDKFCKASLLFIHLQTKMPIIQFPPQLNWGSGFFWDCQSEAPLETDDKHLDWQLLPKDDTSGPLTFKIDVPSTQCSWVGLDLGCFPSFCMNVLNSYEGVYISTPIQTGDLFLSLFARICHSGDRIPTLLAKACGFYLTNLPQLPPCKVSHREQPKPVFKPWVIDQGKCLVFQLNFLKFLFDFPWTFLGINK